MRRAPTGAAATDYFGKRLPGPVPNNRSQWPVLPDPIVRVIANRFSLPIGRARLVVGLSREATGVGGKPSAAKSSPALGTKRLRGIVTNRATLYRWIKDHGFPEGFLLGANNGGGGELCSKMASIPPVSTDPNCPNTTEVSA